jgi:N-acetylglucosamine malate deacetylase 1
MEYPSRVLIVCAHSDDQVIGAGGTIAKYARAGADVRTFICSFGESSHPHLKPEEIRKTRVLESKRANQVLGGKSVLFLGMREGHFLEEYHAKKWFGKLMHHVHSFRPQMILTHSSDDPHPDHRAVYGIVMDLYARGHLKSEVLTFDVWNIFNITKRRSVRVSVDITPTFARKLDALSVFKSQRVALFTLLWSVYAKAVFYGFRRKVRYAELFYKVH